MKRCGWHLFIQQVYLGAPGTPGTFTEREGKVEWPEVENLGKDFSLERGDDGVSLGYKFKGLARHSNR